MSKKTARPKDRAPAAPRPLTPAAAPAAAAPAPEPRVSRPKPAPKAPPTQEQIALRARDLWDAAGRPAGRDLEFWFAAERALAAK